MINIKNLTKSYITWNKTNTIYDNLDFKIENGDFVAILWKSWNWKTTLLNIISWLISFNKWKVIVNNIDLSDLSNDKISKFRWKNISFIFQQFHLIPNLTVTENIELPLDINNLKARFKTKDIIKKVWLQGKENAYPYELSWWEQQRVAIARAFIWETPILLADEPTWNIDEETTINIMNILKTLHKETKNTIILITHDKWLINYANKSYELKNKKMYLIKK